MVGTNQLGIRVTFRFILELEFSTKKGCNPINLGPVGGLDVGRGGRAAPPRVSIAVLHVKNSQPKGKPRPITKRCFCLYEFIYNKVLYRRVSLQLSVCSGHGVSCIAAGAFPRAVIRVIRCIRVCAWQSMLIGA